MKQITLDKEKKFEQKALAKSEPSIASLLAEVIKQGVTTENVAALDKLCDLYERVEAKKAERAFNAAFAELQREMPQVAATSPVKNKDGTIRYRFAPFEEIMDKVQPFLTKHGFSLSFNSRQAEAARLTAVCTLHHVGGHSQSNEFTVRIGSGPPGCTETQADAAAKTIAKRGALSDALNIVVDKDEDARLIGKSITDAQAAQLMARVKACGADEAAFLRYAGATTYWDIPEARYDALDALLARKESGMRYE
jgi:ERF superfamily protein